jgi:uncharacterized protein with von Willebrand factor type A (vWA) domain
MPEYLVTGGERGAVLLKKTPHNLIERKSLVGFALDRSGSMAPLATVAIQSVNQLLEEQRKIAAGDSRFTLTLFNNDVRLVHDSVSLSEVPLLLSAQYQPSGGTAFNDAIAHLIRSLSAHAQCQGNSVLAVILTDGEENSP